MFVYVLVFVCFCSCACFVYKHVHIIIYRHFKAIDRKNKFTKLKIQSNERKHILESREMLLSICRVRDFESGGGSCFQFGDASTFWNILHVKRMKRKIHFKSNRTEMSRRTLATATMTMTMAVVTIAAVVETPNQCFKVFTLHNVAEISLR